VAGYQGSIRPFDLGGVAAAAGSVQSRLSQSAVTAIRLPGPIAITDLLAGIVGAERLVWAVTLATKSSPRGFRFLVDPLLKRVPDEGRTRVVDAEIDFP
jgi:hypothetical protein